MKQAESQYLKKYILWKKSYFNVCQVKQTYKKKSGFLVFSFSLKKKNERNLNPLRTPLFLWILKHALWNIVYITMSYASTAF